MINMTIMIDDLNEIKRCWELFDVKHTDFDKDTNILFHPDIKIKEECILLDIGCGPGRLARLSHNLVKQYYGIDISKPMVEEGKRKYNYNNVTFLQNDGRTLKEFKDNFFDVVVVATVFQHIGKKIIKSYMNEIYRTLKTDGFFVINFPRLSFYKEYGFNIEELNELLKKFKFRELDCDKEPTDKVDYRINIDAHFYILGEKNG